MAVLHKIHLKRGRAGSVIGRHPWLFESAIRSIDGDPEDGSRVEVYENDGRFLAHGLFNSKSQIRVRLYGFKEEEVFSEDWLRRKLQEGIRLRTRLLDPTTCESGCRLIFSEADGISGLIVDRFENYLLLQITSLGLYERRAQIAKILRELTEVRGIFLKAEKTNALAEGFAVKDESLYGELPPHEICIRENDIDYLVSLTASQKTGFYFDQRDNRKKLRSWVRPESSVLDLYCYTGGFALNAAAGRASEVLGVDSSERAIETARANAKKNSLSARFEQSDSLDFLNQLSVSQTFDMVVADPPKLAPSKASKERALRAYFAVNELTLKRVKSGGLLVSCSCSQAISSSDFWSVISSVARRQKRDVTLVYEGSQASDHPVSFACPETKYLKAFFCYVR